MLGFFSAVSFLFSNAVDWYFIFLIFFFLRFVCLFIFCHFNLTLCGFICQGNFHIVYLFFELINEVIKINKNFMLAVDPLPTSPQLSAICCHFSSASVCDPSTCFQFTWQCLCPKQFGFILGDLVRHCIKSFIKIMLCISHPGVLHFYQKSNHVSLARHVPYEPMLLIIVPLFFECLEECFGVVSFVSFFCLFSFSPQQMFCSFSLQNMFEIKLLV